jgi:hypothetical protein
VPRPRIVENEMCSVMSSPVNAQTHHAR